MPRPLATRVALGKVATTYRKILEKQPTTNWSNGPPMSNGNISPEKTVQLLRTTADQIEAGYITEVNVNIRDRARTYESWLGSSRQQKDRTVTITIRVPGDHGDLAVYLTQLQDLPALPSPENFR